MSFPFAPSQIQKCISLQDAILPMSTAAMALPPLSIRGDWGVLSTAATRYGPSLLKSFAQMGPQGALSAMKLLRPFSEIIDSLELKDPFIRNWIDLLSFLLAGVKSDGVLSAEMVTISSFCLNFILSSAPVSSCFVSDFYIAKICHMI